MEASLVVRYEQAGRVLRRTPIDEDVKKNRARGSGSGQMALLDIRLDFDIGTQPSTATPPGPRASPLDTQDGLPETPRR